MKKHFAELALLIGTALTVSASDVVINEIMYHPRSENIREQWIELHNTTDSAINLSGWAFTKGISYTFPEGTGIEANGYLVITADTEAFAVVYSDVTNVIGSWDGKLSNRGENIRLTRANGKTETEVHYSPEGDWAQRRLIQEPYYGCWGWDWYAEHQGAGKSAELIDPSLPISIGQNWNSSQTDGGTPGAVNSWYDSIPEQAPLLCNVSHSPALPQSTEAVTISVQVHTSSTEAFQVTTHWKTTDMDEFEEVEMLDNGDFQENGDTQANDGYFSAKLPEQPNGTIVEFYLTVFTVSGLTRTYPNVEEAPGRTPWLLYQVDEERYAGDQPMLRIILDPLEYNYLKTKIWGEQGLSEALVNGTVICQTPSQPMPEIFYQAGFRNRGKGTASLTPHNIHINLPKDSDWEGRTSFNTNTKDTYCQIISSVIAREIGLPMAESRPVKVRINGEDLTNPIAPQFGSYAGNEPINSDFVDRQFPLDNGGNLYRGKRYAYPQNLGIADLGWRTESWTSYTNAYVKENNSMENDWSDLVELIRVLNKTPNEEYVEAVKGAVNVENWMQYFALNTLLANQETCLATGVGDDFALYRGERDPRFSLIVYDMDSVMGLGERTEPYRKTIWPMNELPAVRRFMTNSAFSPLYFKHLRELGTGIFAPERMNALLDNVLGDWISPTALNNMKTFNANHVAYVLSQIPGKFSINNTFEEISGYPGVRKPDLLLEGSADAEHTSQITINGIPVDYTAWQGKWSCQLKLNPGLNFIIIKIYDLDGEEIEYKEQYILCDTGSTHILDTDTITEDTTLTAVEGPWQINKKLNIAEGATLTIEPGTCVYLNTGVTLSPARNARIVAEGTEAAPIVLAGIPGGGRWSSVTFNHTGVTRAEGDPENRFCYVHFKDFGGVAAINCNYGTFFLDHLTFGTTDCQYINLNWCSFMISHCRFPESTGDMQLVRAAGGTLMGGRGIFYRNYFGKVYGHNDPADITDGNWIESGKFQIIENVFMGSGDDLLDLDGTDAWIEGNILMHSHQNKSWGGASAISGGKDEGRTSELYITGNLFYDDDHAVKAKDGNFHIVVNNTIVRITNEGGNDSDCGMLGCVDVGYPESKGYYFQDNITYDIKNVLRGHTNAVITFEGNLLSEPWNTTEEWARGGNNSLCDPKFVYIPAVEETLNFQTWEQAQIMKKWFAPQAGSPAIGTAENGRNKGMFPRRGVSISGEPSTPVSSRNIQLRIGSCYSDFGVNVPDLPNGAGYIAYRYRLSQDGIFGEWSDEHPITQPLVLNDLEDGIYFVEVSGKKHIGIWDDDPYMGEALYVARSAVWEISAGAPGEQILPQVRLNEIDFKKQQIEILNFGDAEIDMSGFFITDDPELPEKIGLSEIGQLSPKAYSIISAGDLLNLNTQGGQLYLMQGETVCDSVTWGQNIPEYTLGRMNANQWTLCTPTPGSENLCIALGDAYTLKINEWLTSEQSTGTDDFVEIYNPGSLPVAMGGLFLSDAPMNLNRSAIAENTYIPAQGFVVFMADGKPEAGYDHLTFKLSASIGSIFLSDSKSNIIDSVAYHSQKSDISSGRSPDGGDVILSLDPPSPGTKNLGYSLTRQIETESVTLISMTNQWKFDQSGTNLLKAWRENDYDDSEWETGRALFYNEYEPMPAPKNTPLTLGPVTYYFRTTFDVTEKEANDWNDPHSYWQFHLYAILDDGIVVYHDNEEFCRVNMRDGDVYYTTFAISNEGRLQGPYTVELPNLHAGTNYIAAELHQDKPGSSDAVMGIELLAERYLTNYIPSVPSVRISEIFAASHTYRWNKEDLCDWVELFNPTEITLDLGGMSLSCDPKQPTQFVLPMYSILKPGEYLVIPCSESLPGSSVPAAPFDLSKNGGTVYLFAADGSLMDTARYGFQISDLSVSRMEWNSANWQLSIPTPGKLNQAIVLGNADQVKINEWMATPLSGGDWFELYNPGTLPVDLSGYYLTDDLNNLTQYRIPDGSYLGAGLHAWIKIMADEELEKGAHHVNFKLSSSGETLTLSNPRGAIVDIVTFGKQKKGISEGRYPNGDDLIYAFEYETPGARNILDTYPDDFDADTDGMPDVWESKYGFDPNDPADATLDPDGDGLTNIEEYWIQTDPLDPEDCLKIFNIRMESIENERWVVFVIPVVQGVDYCVEYRENEKNAWETLVSLENITQTGLLEIKAPWLEQANGFYRLIALPR